MGETEAGVVQPGGDGRATPSLLDTLCADLEVLGLNGSEARVLVALLQVNCATGSELSRLSKVPRTAVYPVLDQLRMKQVVEAVPGPKTQWVSIGSEEALRRLFAGEEERFGKAQAAVERARWTLEELARDEPAMSFASLEILRAPAQLSRVYDRLLATAQSEVLVANKGPYGRVEVEPAVMEMLARGVATRALYQQPEVDDPEYESLLDVAAVYRQAGVEERVVESLPMAFAVFDRKEVLFSLDGPDDAPNYDLVPVHVLDPGFAASQVATFEHFWARGRPLPVEKADRDLDLRDEVAPEDAIVDKKPAPEPARPA